MKSVIIKPRNEILKNYIHYFLFFEKHSHGQLTYTTFPNNNLCLAIYKGNHIIYNKQLNQNHCIITEGYKSFESKLYGFHKMPFKVDITGYLDQICILFKPSALRAFTDETYANLMGSDGVFDIFKASDQCIIELIFEEKNFYKRAEQLEQLLLRNLKYKISYLLPEALHIITTSNDKTLTVELLAKKLRVSTPTLFRLFKNNLGQNPKSYLQTVRFRNVLADVLNKEDTLTNIAYLNQFYDQAHCINDFKTFSGYSPNQLLSKVSLQEDELAWIYNKK